MTGQEPNERPEGAAEEYAADASSENAPQGQQAGGHAPQNQQGAWEGQGDWQARPHNGNQQPQGNWQDQQYNQGYDPSQQGYVPQPPQQGNWQGQPHYDQQGYAAQGYNQAPQGAWQGQPPYGQGYAGEQLSQPQQGYWQAPPQQGAWQGQQNPTGPGTGEKLSDRMGRRTREAATSLRSKSLPRLMGGILAALGVLQLIAGLMGWYKFEASMSVFGLAIGSEGNINGFGRAKAVGTIPFEGKQTEIDWIWQGTVAEVIVLALVAAAAVLAFRNIRLRTVGIFATVSGVLGLAYSIFFAVALNNAMSGEAGEVLDQLTMVEHGRGFGFYFSILISIAIGAMGVWLIVKKPAEIDAQRNKFLSDVATRSTTQANQGQQPMQPPQGHWQGQPQQSAWQPNPPQQPQQGYWQAQAEPDQPQPGDWQAAQDSDGGQPLPPQRDADQAKGQSTESPEPGSSTDSGGTGDGDTQN